MTPPNPLIELAERVQALTLPDRAMDCEIAVAVGAFAKRKNEKYDDRIDYVDLREPGNEIWPGYGGDQFVPDYTASLDAAMTLVPNNHRWLMNGPDVDGAGDDIKPCASVMPYGESLLLPQDSHEAATPVLAFLSASLRARAASEAHHG